MTEAAGARAPARGIIARERGMTPEVEAQIFQAAMRVFAEKGFARAKVEEVAEEAGLARATIYYHFRSKRDLFLFLLREGIALMADHVRAEVDAATSTREALVRLVEAHVDFFAEYQAFTQVILLETWRIDPEADVTPEGILAPDLAVVGEVLERARAEGIVKRLDPGVLVSSFFGLVSAAAIYFASYRREFPHKAMKKALLEIFLRGVLDHGGGTLPP